MARNNGQGNKQSIYLSEDMKKEIQDEADRLDRTFSWIIQHVWKMMRDEVKRMPAPDELVDKAKKNRGEGRV